MTLIRQRERRGYVKEAQGYTSWIEWQVVDGRKVIARFDTEEMAKQFVEAPPPERSEK